MAVMLLTGRGPDTHLPKPPVAAPAPDLYDSETARTIPEGAAQALYANGWYKAPSSSVNGHDRTLWIDVTGSNAKADVLDVERYDASPQQAGPWAAAAHRDHPGRPVIVYLSLANWTAARASVARYHVSVKWWLADPTGVPHMVPGASATQWYWGSTTTHAYDESETTPGFWQP